MVGAIGNRVVANNAAESAGTARNAGTAEPVDTRRWAGLAVLLAGAFLPPLDFFIVNVALPSIRADLHAPAATMQMTVSSYATAYAVMLITGGRLGDLWGRRNVFVAGMACFAAASALCGFAWSPGSLIAGRVLQGLAAAVMAPQSLASINAIFPPAERPRALGFYAATFGLASMAGLFLGGALIAANPLGLGWRSIFLINLPVVAVAVPSALLLLRDTRADQPSRLDIGGAVLLAAALTTMIIPLIEGRERGWPAWCFVLLACFPLLAALFWCYEHRVDAAGREPIVVPRLLSVPGLVRGLVAALFFYALAAFWLVFSVYQQAGLGRSPFGAGLAILPAAAGFILGPFASAFIGQWLGRWTAGGGMALQAAGLFGTAALAVLSTPAYLPAPLFLIGAGQGIAMPNMVGAIVARVGKQWSGLAAGLVNSTFQVSGALAVAVIGGLFYAVLGPATDLPAIAWAYGVAAVAIGACLLVAAWLTSSLPETSPQAVRQAGP